MDWTSTELQQAIEQLAPDVLGTPDAWSALDQAELLALEGPLETASLLIEVGRAGAHVPVLETLVLGGPIRDRRAGEVLTGALLEPGSRDPRHVATVARDGRLHGRKTCVPAVDRAARVVVPAVDGLYAVALADVEIVPQAGTASDPLGELVLDGAPGVRLGGPELVGAWLGRVHLGVAALQVGLCRSAVSLTASYVRERKQFGVPVGSFQAVRQRLADAWIDLQGMEVALWQAAWRLHEGVPAEREVLIARYVAAEGSHRVLAAAQHLHGGFGFDRDYPLHRRFLVSKQWEFLLGGASARLEELGDLLAATPVPSATAST
jgi:alkylation response protein AidB-like acyl-CoA dehydrogenase